MEDLLTVDELARKLKFSRVNIYKMVRLKTIPYFHINRAIRFSPSEIDKWLEEKRGQEYHVERIVPGKKRGRRKREKMGAEAGALAIGDASAGLENSCVLGGLPRT